MLFLQIALVTLLLHEQLTQDINYYDFCQRSIFDVGFAMYLVTIIVCLEILHAFHQTFFFLSMVRNNHPGKYRCLEF